MADEQQPQPPAQSPAGQQGQEQEPGPVPYERFKKVNETAKQLEARLAKIEADQKAVREKELTEQQKWQKLYEEREAELTKERLINARLRVATTKGLPADLIDRLQGSTEEELAADAEKLLALFKPTESAAPKAPGVPPSRGSKPARLDITGMTPEEIRKNRHQLWQQQQS